MKKISSLIILIFISSCCGGGTNNEKWNTLGQYVWPNPVYYETYEEEIQHLKSWYLNRMEWLDSAFKNL